MKRQSNAAESVAALLVVVMMTPTPVPAQAQGQARIAVHNINLRLVGNPGNGSEYARRLENIARVFGTTLQTRNLTWDIVGLNETSHEWGCDFYWWPDAGYNCVYTHKTLPCRQVGGQQLFTTQCFEQHIRNSASVDLTYDFGEVGLLARGGHLGTPRADDEIFIQIDERRAYLGSRWTGGGVRRQVVGGRFGIRGHNYILPFYSTHIAPAPDVVEQQLRDLIDNVKAWWVPGDLPPVIVGDFNSHVWTSGHWNRMRRDFDEVGEIFATVGPNVRVFGSDGTLTTSFMAYDPSFQGGVSVATGDIDGDGRAEIITGAGAGGGPHVRVFRADGTPLGSGFMAYNPAFRGGVAVAAGDTDGDGRAEVIAGAGPGGGPHVRVFRADGTPLGTGFMAYDAAFLGGISVAAVDIDHDGRVEIITGAGPGGGPHVRAFRAIGTPLGAGFMAYDPGFRGGVEVAAGDIDGDGTADIVTGTRSMAGPHILAFAATGAPKATSFWAYPTVFYGGLSVAVGDVDGNGRGDVITGAGPKAEGIIEQIWIGKPDRFPEAIGTLTPVRHEVLTEFNDGGVNASDHVVTYAEFLTPGENCTTFSPANAQVSVVGGRWRLNVDALVLEDFGGNQTGAERALAVVRHYALNQKCFVGRPTPRFQYYLSSGSAPIGSLAGEHCTQFDFSTLSLRDDGHWEDLVSPAPDLTGPMRFYLADWKIADTEGRGSPLWSFGAQRGTAWRSLALVQKYRFNRHCLLGGPNTLGSYWRR